MSLPLTLCLPLCPHLTYQPDDLSTNSPSLSTQYLPTHPIYVQTSQNIILPENLPTGYIQASPLSPPLFVSFCWRLNATPFGSLPHRLPPSMPTYPTYQPTHHLSLSLSLSLSLRSYPTVTECILFVRPVGLIIQPTSEVQWFIAAMYKGSA